MFKRITGFTLALLTVLISLIGAIPANADFKDGDIVPQKNNRITYGV